MFSPILRTLGFTTHSIALSSIFAGTSVAEAWWSSTLAAMAADWNARIVK